MAIRVLLIDDHPVVRAGLRRVLESELDIEIVADAGTGSSGIDLTRKIRPNVVVTDLLLPDLDGLVVTETISTEVPEARVVILTSVSEEDASVIRAIRAGASGYVVKNADTDVLIRTIRSVAAGQVHLSPRVAARLLQEMRAPTRDVGLTTRQRAVLREMATGRTNKQIAQSLHIALSTVKCHVRGILTKLDAESRTQAALKAVQSRVLSPDELQLA